MTQLVLPLNEGLQRRETVPEHSGKVLQFNRKKEKWQHVFPGYF